MREILKIDRGYPLSMSGINIGFQMYYLLTFKKNVDNNGGNAQAYLAMQQQQVQINQESHLLLFLCQLPWQYESNNTVLPNGLKIKPFEDVFCAFCLLIDKVWVEQNASYMQYNQVMAESKKRFEAALQERPSNFKQFLNILGIKNM